MLNRYYWKMNAKVAKQALAEIEKEQTLMKAAKKLAKKCGGTGDVYTRRDLGCLSVHGFVFKQPPDKKLWKKLKGTEDGYGPRRCRGSEELRRDINAFRGTALQDIEAIVVPKGTQTIGIENGRLRFLSIGVRVKGSDVYIDAPAGWKLKECKRISDVAFERAVGKKAWADS